MCFLLTFFSRRSHADSTGRRKRCRRRSRRRSPFWRSRRRRQRGWRRRDGRSGSAACALSSSASLWRAFELSAGTAGRHAAVGTLHLRSAPASDVDRRPGEKEAHTTAASAPSPRPQVSAKRVPVQRGDVAVYTSALQDHERRAQSHDYLPGSHYYKSRFLVFSLTFISYAFFRPDKTGG